MESIKKIRHLTIVSPSKWLADEASKSQIFADRPIKVIPNSLDENLFFPKDQKISRKLLRLPLNKKIILFVADSVTNYRKGFEFLQKALENFDPSIFVLCSIGSANDLNIMNNIQLGQISEEHVMSTAYSAADVFVIPSLIDNLPNTVMESLMCGTPVIGFPTGGIPEMIQNMENGLITEEISADSLKHTVEFFFEKQEIFDREQIRVSAVKKYSKNVQGKAYISLFNDIMNNAI